MTNSVPPLAFLGLAERAAVVRQGKTNVHQTNLIGLKQIVLSNLFPVPQTGAHLVLALYMGAHDAEFDIVFRRSDGFEAAVIQMRLEAYSAPPSLDDLVLKGSGQTLQLPPEGWSLVTIPAPGALLIPTPGDYAVLLRRKSADTGDQVIGHVQFVLVEAEPLTPERIAAIRSDPAATKAIRLELLCSICSDSIRAYTGLERIPSSEDEGFIWYQNLPDRFTCSCGTQNFDLTTYKRNLHGLLGSKPEVSGGIGFVPLYERGALASVQSSFEHLLDKTAPEETFQKFIEENPVLLHQFSPERLFFKAPVLSSYKTDFAVLTPKRELVLIELERPNTKLLKKDGGVHSELQHAFDQVRDWLHLADEHRVAVLDNIGVDRILVGSVRGVVIAGRDKGYSTDHLRKLKGADFGRSTFMTYDDLLGGLAALVRNIEQL